VQAKGKADEDVASLLEGGWVTGLKYADELQVCALRHTAPFQQKFSGAVI
jgi:hypothetical protein